MKPKLIQYVPLFLRNLNIEQRVFKRLDQIEHIPEPAHWHPSTAHLFEIIKESAPKIEEKTINKKVIENVKAIKIFDNGPARKNNILDKRPKKENELRELLEPYKHDLDYYKYGYFDPVKVVHGHFSLKQFDQFMILMSNKSQNELDDGIKKICKKFKIDPDTVKLLFHYLKPLFKFDKKNQK